jgi:multicopper oxidase
VSSRICSESLISCLFCRSSSCTVCHCSSAITCRFASARFWLIITKVETRHAISYEIPEGGIEDRDLTATIKLERDTDDDLDHAIDDNERGLKDTIRVNPKEMVEIAVRFNTYSGRYMYHCHILEHEDRDMMRPFVTMPPELMPFMA